MSPFCLAKFFIILSMAIHNHTCFLTENKENVIESLNKNLNIKHLSIVKDSDFKIDLKILLFVKRLSQQNIYASVLSPAQMNNSINEYFTISSDLYNNQKELIKMFKEKIFPVYPPKTMVILYGKNLKEILKVLFRDYNDMSITKFTWLIVDDFDESYLNLTPYYVPYHSLLLLLKKSTNNENGYFIKDVYHPSVKTFSYFSRHFGFWDKEKGLVIPEPDVYKRRLDLNGTAIQAYYDEEEEEYIDGCNGLKLIECQIVRELSQILNFKLILAPYEAYSPNFPYPTEIKLQIYVVNYLNYLPWFIGPLSEEYLFIYINYDESFKQTGISRLLSPFSVQLWWAILAWIGTSTVLLMIIQYFYKKDKKEEPIFETVWNYLFEPFESFLNQSGQDPPNKFPFSALTLSTRLVSLFIVPAYTGALLSFILLPTIRIPFKDVKEFAEDGSYRLGYMVDYLNLKQYKENTYDYHFKKIYDELSVPIHGQYEKALLEGIDKMCEDHKFAFVFYEITVKNYEGCDPIRIHSAIISGWTVLRLSFNSPYWKIFNRIFRTMKSSGIFERMSNDKARAIGLPTLKLILKEFTIQDEDVKLSNLLPVFITIGVIYVVSLIMLTVEVIYNQRSIKWRD